MSLLIAPDSAEGKERARWDRPKNQRDEEGQFGMNRVGMEVYPRVLYRAGRPTHGNVMITGFHSVHSDDQERVARGQGWSLTQEDAIAAVHAQDTEHATLAAERAYHEPQMSAGAQREAQAVDEQTVFHVPTIPEKKKRGRPTRQAHAQAVTS